MKSNSQLLLALFMLLSACATEKAAQEMQELADTNESNRELAVVMAAENKLLVDGQETDPGNLGSLIRVYFDRVYQNTEPDTARIKVEADRQTLYRFFNNRLDTIWETYFALRDEKALELYSRPYEELNSEEKEGMKRILPFDLQLGDKR